MNFEILRHKWDKYWKRDIIKQILRGLTFIFRDLATLVLQTAN